MTWTQFYDMNSGGDRKEPFERCLIEAPEDQARSVFYSRFGHSADRVTCTCCGEDYFVSEYDTLDESTSRYGPAGCVIYAKDIGDHERTVDVPVQGYVWAD